MQLNPRLCTLLPILLLLLAPITPSDDERVTLDDRRRLVNIYFKEATVGTEERLVGYLKAIIGKKKGDTDKGPRANLILDTQESVIAVPRTEVPCKERETACTATGQDLGLEILGMDVKGKIGTGLLRFQMENIKGKEAIHLAQVVSFDNSEPTWTPGKNGVLGLNPQSQLWSYVYKSFANAWNRDYRLLGLSYRVNDRKTIYKPNENSFLGSKLAINGRVSDDPPVYREYDMSEESEVHFEDAGLRYGVEKQILVQGSSFCVRNSRNVIFGLREVPYSILQEDLSRDLCGKQTGCTIEESEVEKLKDLRFVVKNGEARVEILIKSRDYLYFEDRVAKFGFEKIDEEVCPDQDFLAGRIFLTKAELLFKITKPNSVEIGLAKIPKKYPGSGVNTWFWVILVVLVVAVAGAVVFCVQGGKREKTGTYGSI